MSDSIINNINITEIGQGAAIICGQGTKEELAGMNIGFASNLTKGDTARVLVAASVEAGELSDYSAVGEDNVSLVDVTLSHRYGEPITIEDSSLANMAGDLTKVVAQRVDSAVIASLKLAHSLVTSTNFTTVTGLASVAASAWTIDEFAENVAAIQELGKMRLDSMVFYCRPTVFVNLLAGLKETVAAPELATAVINANSFMYLGVKVIKSTNLPTAIKGGYFADGTHLAIGFGIEKLPSGVSNTTVESFQDDATKVGFSIRSFYVDSLGAFKYIPYVITGAAVANANGAVIPSLT